MLPVVYAKLLWQPMTLNSPSGRIRQSNDCPSTARGGSKGSKEEPRPHSLMPPCESHMQCAMFVLITSLCLAFSDADIENDFVLMTSAHSQCLRDSYKQHSALAVADHNLFSSITNSTHCLHQLLPPTRSTQHMQLRDRGHSYILPTCTLQLYKNSFINRCLFDNI